MHLLNFKVSFGWNYLFSNVKNSNHFLFSISSSYRVRIQTNYWSPSTLDTATSTPCHEAWHLLHSALTCSPSSMYGVSNRDTHLYPPRNNPSYHQTTRTYALGGSPMDAEWLDNPTRLALSSSTPAPTLLEWPFQEQRGRGLTASAPVSDVSALAYTNGVWPPCGLWVWRRRTDRRPCCPPMSTNPATSP